MSENFNENLSMFLTSCRESAMIELKENNSEYKQIRSKATEISIKIKNKILAEQEALIEELLGIHHTLHGMEVNYLYLQGFKDCINLYKSFDSSFMESKELEKIFL